MLATITEGDAAISKQLGKSSYSVEEVNAITSTDPVLQKSKADMQKMLSYGMPVSELKEAVQKQLDDFLLYILRAMTRNFNNIFSCVRIWIFKY